MKEDIRQQLLMYLLALDKDEDGDYSFVFTQRHGSWYGKPSFPESTESSDYVTPQSIGFFTTMGLDVEFLYDTVY